MSDSAGKEKPRPGENDGGSGKKAAIVVVVLAVVAVGIVAILNKDRLLVHSDVSTPPSTTEAASATPNQYPEIVALTAATDRIEPFDLCELVCEAIDPDGDELTYTWSVSAGDIFGEGPRIDWGSPVSEGLYRVSVTVDDGRGGTAEYSTSLRVKANVAPAFSAMASDDEWIVGGGSTRVTCEVADADDDDVTLEWTATGGELFGEGDAVIWMAPDEDGVYWVVVYARDSYGGEARRTLPISVTSGEPPKIDGLFLQAVNTDMLHKVGNDWKIYQGRTCTITCAIAGDAGEFTYEWSADFGSLTADGDTATWTAPPSRVGATVVVVVSDERGNQSSASVLIYVETCTCSF